MTAVNVLIGHDRVSLYTDSAALGTTGRVRRLVSKVRPLPGMPCVIAGRGELRVLNSLAKILPTVGDSFDAIYAAAKDGRLQTALGRGRALIHGRLALLLPFDLVVAGWSATGPKAFIFCNHGRMRASDEGSGPKPWTAFDVAWAIIMPTVPMSQTMREHPAETMPSIMERQREHREPSLFNPEGRQMVGGFIEETTITATGVETHRVGGWNDPIGKPIGGGPGARRALRRLLLFTAAISASSWFAFVLGDVAYLLLTGGPK